MVSSTERHDPSDVFGGEKHGSPLSEPKASETGKKKTSATWYEGVISV